MNVSISPALEDFVKAKVDSGLYSSTSEVVREALRLLQEQDEKKAALKAALQAGYNAYKAGHYTKTTAKEVLQNVIQERNKK